MEKEQENNQRIYSYAGEMLTKKEFSDKYIKRMDKILKELFEKDLAKLEESVVKMNENPGNKEVEEEGKKIGMKFISDIYRIGFIEGSTFKVMGVNQVQEEMDGEDNNKTE